MISLAEIKKPIEKEFGQFESYFKETMKSKVPLLSIITNYILRRKGKQMRPILVFLSARLTGSINEPTFVAASMIELLHTATLIHDDVVDEADERRGAFSINALWRTKVAVLVGDYLLSRGLLIAVDKGSFDVLKIVSTAVKEVSEGELLQIEKSRKLDITEDVYYDIIRQKTASLIAACTAGGASSVGADTETIERLRLFGEYLGMAFQVKDDLFDYQAKGFIGKPVGNDIKEKKLTLPLIHVLYKVEKKERKRILKLISRYNNNRQKVDEVVQFVKENGGLEYAEQKMIDFKNKALEMLVPFPESETKTALLGLVEYTISRKK